MQGNLIHLLDGTTMEIKVNFGTLYYMEKSGLTKMVDKAGDVKKGKEMDATAKMIYCILRSNGLKVDEEEAMMLVPPDNEEIKLMFDEFKTQLDKYKKKETAKRTMKALK